MNRIKRYLEESSEIPQYGDFYVVFGEFGSVCVSHEVACRIQSVLDRWIRPRWIEFPDRVGSTVRIRTLGIRSVVQSTAVNVRPIAGSTRLATKKKRPIVISTKNSHQPSDWRFCSNF